jgi:hypothetical protein
MRKISIIQRSSSILGIKQQIDKYIAEHNSYEILILYDIDRTLTQPSHPACYISNRTKYKNLYNQAIKDTNDEQKDIIGNLTILSAPWELVEIETPEIILYYQRQLNIKSLALTGSLTGLLGDVPNLEEWRYGELKKLGIDFSSSFPSILPIKFNKAPSYICRKPMYYNGILLSNGERSTYTKGHLLTDFLEVVKFQPKLVIVIDDKLHFLEKIQHALSLTGYNPKFLGFEYTASAENFLTGIPEMEFSHYWKRLAELSKVIKPNNLST